MNIKVILLSLCLLCLFNESLYAQLPFVSHQPVQAEPVNPRPQRPYTPPADPMDPLGLGGAPVRVPNFTAQKDHFGLLLGSSCDVLYIAHQLVSFYGDAVDAGGTEEFYQVRVYSETIKEGGTFGNYTMDFYKGRFWKIIYDNYSGNPQEFADKLERKLHKYSVSDASVLTGI